MGLKDIDGTDIDSSSNTKRKYVQPTKDDFDGFFWNRKESWEMADDPSAEYCVETEDFVPNNPDVVLRCYTTVDKRTGKARDKGADAIRLVVWDRTVDRPIAGREKTLRIKTWKKNLGGKIDDLMNRGQELVTFCPECGSRMVIRESKYGKFFGCLNYPECTGTREYDE